MSHESDSTRRKFLKTAAVGASVLAATPWARRVHAGSDDTLRVGLIGAGGRGRGAAMDALSADKNAKLVAIGDTFADRANDCLTGLLRNSSIASRVDVTPERIFSGFDCYKQVIDADVDVVLLCTPPHFRPVQFAYAVEKNKHTFVEKPVAVDPVGVRSVLATSEIAKQKGLAVVSGLCWRYHYGKRAVMDQIHSGTIGDVVAMHCAYNTGELWHRGSKPEWSPMEYQIRNWLYFDWLSGDHITEQHIHSIDKMAWVMHDEPPVKVSSMGGRQKRTAEKWGNVYDHFASVYEYAGGQKLFSNCRQQDNCTPLVNDFIFGTKGQADVMKHRIKGETKWRFRGKGGAMYQIEHEEFFASIRSGNPINNGEYMSRSTLMAIMARMSAYTGQDVTWKQAMESELDLTPPAYQWGDAPTVEVAMPGRTKLV